MVQLKMAPRAEPKKKLPVTLLSGFLGSGKTTLLEHILRSPDHGLKIAVIINDMAEINIDASLLANHRVTQKEEKVVQMQNGCICCTLREDLLEEVALLAQAGEFDYLVIESTGISEPMQVAEAWTTEFWDMLQADAEAAALSDDSESTAFEAEIDANGNVTEIKIGKDSIEADDGTPDIATAKLDAKGRVTQINNKEELETRLTPELMRVLAAGGLAELTTLDTVATVIDAFNFFANFDTAEMLTDRYGKDVDPEDERNITELMIDQIEFANVILLNKVDMVPPSAVERIQRLIKQLNPSATVFPTTRSKVDVKEIVNTGAFNFDKAATSAGWLKSLSEEVNPETVEYGISSFVYRARRPFHPRRLYELVLPYFVIIQDAYEEDDDDEVEEMITDDGEGELEDADGEDDEMEVEEEGDVDLDAKLKAKRESPLLKGLLRSKGFIWIATRPGMFGEWSQAGGLLTIGVGSPWFCTLEEHEWPFESPQAIADIKKDFVEPWGDRRQEIALIGENLDKDALTAALDSALVNDAEWKKIQKVMNKYGNDFKKQQKLLMNEFEDGWESWDVPAGAMTQSHEGHAHTKRTESS